jgi:hypothetical protein
LEKQFGARRNEKHKVIFILRVETAVKTGAPHPFF